LVKTRKTGKRRHARRRGVLRLMRIVDHLVNVRPRALGATVASQLL
jgi:hypothetical protein